jgi:hypothetical protein
MDHSFAETLPTDKTSRIAQQQELRQTLCFTVDGISMMRVTWESWTSPFAWVEPHQLAETLRK